MNEAFDYLDLFHECLIKAADKRIKRVWRENGVLYFEDVKSNIVNLHRRGLQINCQDIPERID